MDFPPFSRHFVSNLYNLKLNKVINLEVLLANTNHDFEAFELDLRHVFVDSLPVCVNCTLEKLKTEKFGRVSCVRCKVNVCNGRISKH